MLGIVVSWFQSNMLSYMLATNLISRRIHHSYVRQAEQFCRRKPEWSPQLVITIEEAHRFPRPCVKLSLAPLPAMRKYFVTLLVVDQRPSGIDNEVMSQIGTACTLLNDEKTLAIFTGSGQSLRSVPKLDSKQQALILGHAVPMPVVVRTRPYDETFYAEMGCCLGRKVRWRSVHCRWVGKADLGFWEQGQVLSSPDPWPLTPDPFLIPAIPPSF